MSHELHVSPIGSHVTLCMQAPLEVMSLLQELLSSRLILVASSQKQIRSVQIRLKCSLSAMVCERSWRGCIAFQKSCGRAGCIGKPAYTLLL